MDCNGCTFARSIPGDCHTRCAFKWFGSELTPPKGDPHGIKNGWWRFPFNFDPTWMIGECEARSTVEVPEKTQEKYDPLLELFTMLR